MLIKIVLIVAIGITFLYFLGHSEKMRVKAWTKLILITTVGFAIVSILVPDLTAKAAHLLGVGRGADLLFYLFIVTSVFLFTGLYIRIREIRLRQDKIASQIAILERKITDKK